jgi:hypothetical protein
MIVHWRAHWPGDNGQAPERKRRKIFAEPGREGYAEGGLVLAWADGDPVAIDVIPSHLQKVIDSLPKLFEGLMTRNDLAQHLGISIDTLAR